MLLHECAKDCRNGIASHDPRRQQIPSVDFDTSCISPPCGHKSPCVRLVLADRRLWKNARLTIHQLLMKAVLMDFEHKQNFGRLLVQVGD